MVWLNVLLLIVAGALMATILLQNRSAGLGGAFGGGGEGFHIRRGGEKRLFQVTVLLSILFIGLAAVHLFIR